MGKPKITAKDFFLWVGAMAAFYWSVIAYIYLVFGYINYALPNALAYYSADPYQSGISYRMASIIILFPLYMWLMWFIRRDITRDPSRSEVWIRRWALILTLFVAGVAMAIDLITLLATFLNGGELTIAFLLKVLLIFLVAAGVFMHFSADLKGYWERFPLRKRSVGTGVAILVLITIIIGFFIVAQMRLVRLDAQKVTDLRDLQSLVANYWQERRVLPASLADLNGSIGEFSVPSDPQTGASYEYRITGNLSFELCADFNTVFQSYNPEESLPQSVPPGISTLAVQQTDSWHHGVGRSCFERTINPSFYPPFSK